MINGWEKALSDYIEAKRRKMFIWGPNDCISFSNGAMQAICGYGFGDHWVGRYQSALGAKRVFEAEKKKGGFEGIIDAIDDKLTRTTFPSRGSIVARAMDDEFFGYRIGVCIGNKIAFAGARGLLFEPVRNNDIAWKMP